MESLVVSKNRYVKEPKFAIQQRKGGPYIDLMFFRGYSGDAVIPYKRSAIDMYPNFIHADGHEEFRASQEIKDYYNNLVKYIKSKCKVITKGNKRYLISTKVLKELNI